VARLLSSRSWWVRSPVRTADRRVASAVRTPELSGYGATATAWAWVKRSPLVGVGATFRASTGGGFLLPFVAFGSSRAIAGNGALKLELRQPLSVLARRRRAIVLASHDRRVGAAAIAIVLWRRTWRRSRRARRGARQAREPPAASHSHRRRPLRSPVDGRHRHAERDVGTWIVNFTRRAGRCGERIAGYRDGDHRGFQHGLVRLDVVYRAAR
jgi:hypothetical protein